MSSERKGVVLKEAKRVRAGLKCVCGLQPPSGCLPARGSLRQLGHGRREPQRCGEPSHGRQRMTARDD